MIGPFGVIHKSYVNGAWTSITALPKSTVMGAASKGKFGQKHLENVKDFRKMTTDGIKFTHDQGNKALKGVELQPFKHPLADQKNTYRLPWQFADTNDPNVREVGQKKFINGAWGDEPKNFIESDKWKGHKDAAIQRFGDVGNSSADDIVTHEAAHARPTRKKTPRTVDRMMRAINNGQNDVAGNGGFSRESWTNATVGRVSRANTREEAHADVLASRHQGHPVLSGHWKEKGYLDDRNMIARGMKQPELKPLPISQPGKVNIGSAIKPQMSVKPDKKRFKNIAFKKKNRPDEYV